jgi:hypothetical protein
MTFKTWFEDMQKRYQSCYSEYEELLQEAFEAGAEQERNFCERCGKRLGSGIHTCTPPAAQRQWVGLTEQEAAECWSTSTVRTWRAIEAKLKEKNT